LKYGLNRNGNSYFYAIRDIVKSLPSKAPRACGSNPRPRATSSAQSSVTLRRTRRHISPRVPGGESRGTPCCNCGRPSRRCLPGAAGALKTRLRTRIRARHLVVVALVAENVLADGAGRTQAWRVAQSPHCSAFDEPTTNLIRPALVDVRIEPQQRVHWAPSARRRPAERRWGWGDLPPCGCPFFSARSPRPETSEGGGPAMGSLPRASYATARGRNVNATHFRAEPFRYNEFLRQERCRAPLEEGSGDGDLRPEKWTPDGGR
jgi:hypothetical protein